MTRWGQKHGVGHENRKVYLGGNSGRHGALWPQFQRSRRPVRADGSNARRGRGDRHPRLRAAVAGSQARGTSVQEVVTAEDIGKMPDKNVADSLTRVPGVTTSSASANEGGFDENDRVSMRGTNPSLTQTLINGHGVAAGDWFVLNQVQQVGRSVSYTLLPSELVSQVVVHKSSQASLVEGGVAGSVDIITRKPLDFSKPLTLQASAGAVYADLPSKTDRQYSALFNWKNDARKLRRPGARLLRGAPSATRRRRDTGLRADRSRQSGRDLRIRISRTCGTRR